MIAVSLFDKTGVMLKPWLEAGYECHIFDIQHPSGFARAVFEANAKDYYGTQATQAQKV